jgi:hypothetical protein
MKIKLRPLPVFFTGKAPRTKVDQVKKWKENVFVVRVFNNK